MSAAATARGTSTPARRNARGAVRCRRGAAPGPAAAGRTGCRRSRRRARRPPPRRVAQQLAGLPRAQRARGRSARASPAVGALERAGQALAELARTHGERDQDARVGRPPQERAEELDRAAVGPVQVVEEEHEGPRWPPAPPAARAPRDGCGSARPARRVAGRGPERGKTRAELRSTSGARRVQRRGSTVRRTRRRRRRTPRTAGPPPTRGAARQHDAAARRRARGELPEQARLPDARLSGDLEQAGSCGARARRSASSRAPSSAARPTSFSASWASWRSSPSIPAGRCRMGAPRRPGHPRRRGAAGGRRSRASLPRTKASGRNRIWTCWKG